MTLTVQYILTPLLCVLSVWLYEKWLQAKSALSSISNRAGYRTLFDQTSITPSLIGFSPEKNVTWLQKYEVFERFGWDIISAVSFFPTTALSFFVADPEAIKEIALKRWKFPKHMKEYKVFEMFGSNILVTEGQEWKKHRKVSSPAYSVQTNKVVWEESCRIMQDAFEEWGATFLVDNVVDLTFTIALKVISISGFGTPYQADRPPGHTMSFGDALRIVTTDGFLKLAVPNWAMFLTPRLRKTRIAFDEFWQYMRELVAARNARQASPKQDVVVEHNDLFSNLLDANETVGGTSGVLDDNELFGNIFIGLFAGHETTAHTLAFALILLAQHPTQQDILYKHIKSVMKDSRVPRFEDMNLYTHTAAVINETLRMYAPVTGLPKYCTEDCVLSAASAISTEERIQIPVPRGSKVVIDVPGLHYNKKYWPDPHKYDPSRFLREWNPDAFIPFAVGSRACLGRNFFETEATAVLTLLVANYYIELPSNVQHVAGQAVVVEPGLALQPAHFPIVLRRRN